VQLEDVFCQINSDRSNLHHWTLLTTSVRMVEFTILALQEAVSDSGAGSKCVEALKKAAGVAEFSTSNPAGSSADNICADVRQDFRSKDDHWCRES